MWTSGYVTEIGYTHGYYRELKPHTLALAALSAAHDGPSLDNLSYLELGFGQGVSVNMHAATAKGTFWGTDFNPEQAAYAQSLAKASGAEAHLFDLGFDELAARDDLPDFDIIALHGIWTWISDENRAAIIDIARRKLKPGGLFYVSYNVTPGWSPAMPLRHLMTQYASEAGSGSVTAKIDQALAFTQSLIDAGATYFKANPAVVTRYEKLKDQQRAYLAHEYMNANWDVMPFADTAALLSEAKLSFAASAHLPDHVNAINLNAEAQKLMAGIESPTLRQTVRDYMVNQQFRRDIFIKGARRLTALEKARRLRAISFALVIHPEDQAYKITGSLGEANLQEDVYKPILEVLADDGFRPKTLDELAKNPRTAKLNHDQAVQALTILCGMGSVMPAQDGKTAKSVTKTAQALNAHLTREAESSANVSVLASPMVGGGINVNRFEQLFIRALENGQKDPVAWVWSILKMQGQRLVKDGEAIQDDDGNLAELRDKYDTFKTKRLAILQRLGVTVAKV